MYQQIFKTMEGLKDYFEITFIIINSDISADNALLASAVMPTSFLSMDIVLYKRIVVTYDSGSVYKLKHTYLLLLFLHKYQIALAYEATANCGNPNKDMIFF